MQASGLGLGLCGFGFGLVGPCVLAALMLGFRFFLLVVIRLMDFRSIIINILRRKKKKKVESSSYTHTHTLYL